MTQQGGAFWRPLYRDVECSHALGADASLTEEAGAAVATGGAGAALETAAIETAVAIDTVVAAEGCSADGRALRVSRAGPAKGDIAPTQAAADWLANTISAIDPAAALRSRGAATALVTAAVQRTISGDPVVVTENGAARLTALGRLGALPAEPYGPTITTRGSTDAVGATQTTAADGISIARAAVVVAAVQDAVGVDPIRGADRGPRRLAALTGLPAFRTERQATGAIIGAETIHAIEATAASSAIVATGTGTAFIAATVQRTIAVKPIVSTDRGPAALAALRRRSALRPWSEPSRRRRSRRGATTGAVHTEEIRAALNVVRARAAGIAAAVAGAIGGDAVTGANDRSAALATFAGRRALGAERPPAGTPATTATRAAGADRSTAAMEVGGARAAGVTAAIELAVANNAVVAADDGAASLATLGVGAERGTLPAKRNRVLCMCYPWQADWKRRCSDCGGNSLEHATPGHSDGDRPG
ncbi:MAG: hypothetical protein K0S99_26 [Thermomicrobiales bacterium]|nr:hypothetical protein [Thermomicrobiales bacterium]